MISPLSKGSVTSETLCTWGTQREAASVPRAMRRVDWPLTVGQRLRLPQVQSPEAPTLCGAVLDAADELAQYRDHNTLLRRAVELSRERLGLVRAALFIRGTAADVLHGTWGTSADGQTTDERDISFLMGRAHREAMARSRAAAGRWLLLNPVPLTTQLDKQTHIIGYGWNALTPVRSTRGLVGLFVNDPGLSATPCSIEQQDRLIVFCALLGHLLDRRAEHAGSALHPHESSASSDVAAHALRILNEDTSLCRQKLAARLGVSASSLARAFKSELGLSIADYKNRVRLERFLTLVDPHGGNLLAAALNAGFGSYAQFHRVFRAAFGTTPRDYLAELAHIPARDD